MQTLYRALIVALLACAPAALADGKAVVIEEADEEVPPAPTGEERRAIGNKVRENQKEVNACYAARIAARPELSGTLVAKFDIGADGRVVGATAEGIADPALVACVVKSVRGWSFAKPASGKKLRISYPFLLTSAALASQ